MFVYVVVYRKVVFFFYDEKCIYKNCVVWFCFDVNGYICYSQSKFKGGCFGLFFIDIKGFIYVGLLN